MAGAGEEGMLGARLGRGSTVDSRHKQAVWLALCIPAYAGRGGGREPGRCEDRGSPRCWDLAGRRPRILATVSHLETALSARNGCDLCVCAPARARVCVCVCGAGDLTCPGAQSAFGGRTVVSNLGPRSGPFAVDAALASTRRMRGSSSARGGRPDIPFILSNMMNDETSSLHTAICTRRKVLTGA